MSTTITADTTRPTTRTWKLFAPNATTPESVRETEPLHWRSPQRCAINGDLFHEDVPGEFLDRVFAVMALTPHITYQVLTKRPERMRAYLSEPDRAARVDISAAIIDGGLDPQEVDQNGFVESVRAAHDYSPCWPLPNVWLGVSVEDQAAADSRYGPMRDLNQVGWTTFVSAEPLLGPVDFMPWLKFAADWIIVGGESGAKARPCNIEWIRDIVRQCQAAGVPVFVKQLGSKPREHFLDHKRGTDGYGHDWPVDLAFCGDRENPALAAHHVEEDWWRPVLRRHNHGGNPDEWPADLRVREFPA